MCVRVCVHVCVCVGGGIDTVLFIGLGLLVAIFP